MNKSKTSGFVGFRFHYKGFSAATSLAKLSENSKKTNKKFFSIWTIDEYTQIFLSWNNIQRRFADD